MIRLKSAQDIQKMKEGGIILKSTLEMLLKKAKPGISLLDLDRFAEEEIKRQGGESSFKKVPNYKWTTCIAVNDVVVHGIPTEQKIKEGDVVGIDCGVYYKGFHTDAAWTIYIGNNPPKEIEKFLKAGEEALYDGLSQVKVGNRIGHISQSLQKRIEKDGYIAVKSLTGHGVGKDLHEDPDIPGILSKKIENTPEIIPGMVLAIEIIYNMGSPDVIYKNDDGWTISTKDGKISGLFEKTVAVGHDGVVLLT